MAISGNGYHCAGKDPPAEPLLNAGEMIRALRTERGLTQQQCAEAVLGSSTRHSKWARIEAGHSKEFSLADAIHIATFFHVSLCDLTGNPLQTAKSERILYSDPYRRTLRLYAGMSDFQQQICVGLIAAVHAAYTTGGAHAN